MEVEALKALNRETLDALARRHDVDPTPFATKGDLAAELADKVSEEEAMQTVEEVKAARAADPALGEDETPPDEPDNTDAQEEAEPEDCSACEGTGLKDHGTLGFNAKELCPTCEGSGKLEPSDEE